MGPIRVLVLAMVAAGAGAADRPAERVGPNVVLIFCDDLGYADVGCFGSKGARTPNIDRLASEGVRFTDFYVAQAVCSASRAALMTGCYNVRVGINGALGPKSKIGLNPAEFNLAKLFKSKGYATGIFGKWHLGDLPQFMPPRQGFDEFVGLPYSNDMWPRHPETPKNYPDLPLYDGEKVVQANPSMDGLTELFTRRAARFIDANKDRPFFLYLPHPMPHVPLGAGPGFKGKSGHGLYGDVISEVDASVGQVMEALRRNGIERETLILFSSDNGPWTTYGDHAGATGPLREAKGTSFEGGVRVPLVARWPGRIAAGEVCREPAMTIDLLPTLAKVLGVPLPTERKIDGKDIGPLLFAAAGQRPTDAPPIHEALFFYWDNHLQAVRSGKWKLHFPHDYRKTPEQRATGGKPNKATTGKIGLSLFDLEADPGETTDVAERHAEVVKRLQALAEEMRKDLGDSATKTKGNGRREPGRVAE
jgi:arylsulfatase A-like enzyme